MGKTSLRHGLMNQPLPPAVKICRTGQTSADDNCPRIKIDKIIFLGTKFDSRFLTWSTQSSPRTNSANENCPIRYNAPTKTVL